MSFRIDPNTRISDLNLELFFSLGKNDLWIAAVASFKNLTLMTADRGFEHLDGVFLDLEYIDVEEILGMY